ncbi:MAG: hypothetical protein M3072_15825, partial [Candidatus Dormibacteraeota bacterium]|nr:hypothetical protein [Candidatus Dormibacteraeota bacterium]
MGRPEMALRRFYTICFAMLAAGLLAAFPTVGLAAGSFIGQLKTVRVVASTVPPSIGDVNPYGVAVEPRTVGRLTRGHVLVSNFNNSANLQGTGTTIVDVSPGGQSTLFAQINAGSLPGACPGGIGLTTALVVLRSGWVVVGSLPTSDGMAHTAKAGCLLVLDSRGHVVKTLSGDGINGPWDMTAFEFDDFAALFVTNVLNGTVAAGGATVNRGTVLRIDLLTPEGRTPIELHRRVIASGFPERTDIAALVVGPTGVGLARDGTLYVADTVGNRITAVRDALFRDESGGIGKVVSADGDLNGPLGLAVAPNGDILTVNAGDGKLVETTPKGAQVGFRLVDNTGS